MFDRQRVVKTKTGSVKKDWKGDIVPCDGKRAGRKRPDVL
jgi:hypothetical protein